MSNREFLFTGLALTIALVLVSSGLTAGGSGVAAFNPGDFFSYTYSVELTRSEVGTGQSFSALVQGRATSKGDLPLKPNRGEVTTMVVAYHEVSGAEVTLNTGYMMTIDPFPAEKGDTFEAEMEVSLQFPPGSEFGVYQVVGKLVRARVTHIPGVWISVTKYLPRSQVLSTVNYVETWPPPEEPDPPAPEPLRTVNWPLVSGAAAAVLIAVVAGVLVLRRRRRA